LTPSGAQFSPPSPLAKISLGVVVSTLLAPLRLIVTSWMSGSGTPRSILFQVSPPSRLRRTPSTSTPAQTWRGLAGSTASAVTRGTRTFGHSSAMSTVSCRQLRPLSFERYSAAGRVPAKMMLGFVGSTAIFHTSREFIGDSSRVKLCPPSTLL
jgi:hypothetical protein